jgi:hypothetical protein
MTSFLILYEIQNKKLYLFTKSEKKMELIGV